MPPAYLPEHAGGVILLTGGRGGPLSTLLAEGRRRDTQRMLREYQDWYGPDGVYVELQQNLLKEDAARNWELAALARETGAPLAATNDVHYHCPERYHLQHALVAARRNVTIEQALPYIRPNDHLCLKPPAEMAVLFRHFPEALTNTVGIAEQCAFNLSADLGYTLPDAAVPEGTLPAATCGNCATRPPSGAMEPCPVRSGNGWTRSFT